MKKVVIITGASNGIGKATIDLLTNKGFVTYNLDVERPSDVYADDHWMECDVTNACQVRDCINLIYEKHQEIDGLFSNAGVHHVSTIEEISEADIQRLIQINLFGNIHLLRSVLPIMRKQMHGNIVLMGSDQSLIGKGESAVYGATKAAIASLAKTTAIDYGQYNIRVNCVCPGPVDTRIYENALTECVARMNMPRNDVYRISCSKQPLQRIGKPEEIAEVVAFLLSSASSYMTGALVPIDGGYTAQ